jgi:2-polyprenyl-3-methyl-5-hydroxy-6-metoxy-1,4-benzoquinol methylase
LRRSLKPEILDSAGVSDGSRERAHRDLMRINRWLGNWAAVLARLERGTPPARVLDIGCGGGGLLLEIRRKTGADVVGVDLQPPRNSPVPVMQADAVRDPLPKADVAVSVLMIHHLSEPELAALIRNAGATCDRLIVVDLVRHWLPLALYRVFVCPFVCAVVRSDGAQSIRRAFTPTELRAIVAGALQGTTATFDHSVAIACIRQTVDITFRTPCAPA